MALLLLFKFWHVCPVAIMVGVFRKAIPSFQLDFLRVVDIAACFADFNVNTIIRCLLSGTELMTLTHLPSSFISIPAVILFTFSTKVLMLILSF